MRSWAIKTTNTGSTPMPDPTEYYDASYYTKRLYGAWEADADSIAAAIAAEFDPDSVIDLGCAVGQELRWLYDHDVDISGVDIHPAAVSHSVVPSEHIQLYDLKQPFDPEKPADVVMCIEVAEHLPESAAATLVNSCIRSSEGAVVFSAATPDAGDGTHHVNEQPRDYWIDLFATEGYESDEEALQRLRERMTVVKKTWVPERLFVFRPATNQD